MSLYTNVKNWKTKTTEMTSPVILSLYSLLYFSLSQHCLMTLLIIKFNSLLLLLYIFLSLFLIWYDFFLCYLIKLIYYKLSRLNDYYYYYYCIVNFIQSIISENAYHMKQTLCETLQKCHTILTVPLYSLLPKLLNMLINANDIIYLLQYVSILMKCMWIKKVG